MPFPKSVPLLPAMFLGLIWLLYNLVTREEVLLAENREGGGPPPSPPSPPSPSPFQGPLPPTEVEILAREELLARILAQQHKPGELHPYFYRPPSPWAAIRRIRPLSPHTFSASAFLSSTSVASPGGESKFSDLFIVGGGTELG